ncbi:PKD domain-containing protein [Candidatus Woesearchaeota archaeon]|nr:PKD domain-containing protein [Candidatus Woesearchaeota archaeon]
MSALLRSLLLFAAVTSLCVGTAYGFAMLTPADGATVPSDNGTVTVRFSWDDYPVPASERLADYSLWIDDDSSFSSVDYGYYTNWSFIDVVRDIPDGVWHWKILAATNRSDSTVDYGTFTFIVDSSANVTPGPDGTGTEEGEGDEGEANATAVPPNQVGSPVFSVTTDKDAYAPGDTVFITVMAPNGTNVNMSIASPAGVDRYQAQVFGTMELIYIALRTGGHTASVTFEYYDITETRAAQFDVAEGDGGDGGGDGGSQQVPPLSVSYSFSPSEPVRGSGVSFHAAVSGGTPPYAYAWDFQGDGGTDSTAPNPTHLFTWPGRYDVRLRVTDSRGVAATKEREIDVAGREMDLTVVVRDNRTNARLGNVTVELGDEDEETDDDGEAAFEIEEGMHDLRIAHKGYETYRDELNLTEANSSIAIRLIGEEEEETTPSITLIAPIGKAIVRDEPVALEFRVSDTADIEQCSVYYNDELESGWRFVDRILEPGSGRFRAPLAGLAEGIYKWRVKCANEYGNEGVSPTERFVRSNPPEVAEEPAAPSSDRAETVPAKQAAEEPTSALDPLEARIQEYLAAVDAINEPFARRMFEAAGLSTLDVQISLKRLLADYNNVKRSEKDEQNHKFTVQRITDELSGIAATLPKEHVLLNQKTLVMDITEEDVRGATEAYLGHLGHSPTGSRVRKAASQNAEVADAFTLTLDTYEYEVKYFSGLSTPLTVLDIEVSAELGSLRETLGAASMVDALRNIQLVSTVPKDFAETADGLGSNLGFATIDDDPVLLFSLYDLYAGTDLEKEMLVSRLTFAFPKKVSFDLLEGMRLAPVVRVMAGSGGDAIVGYSVLASPGLTISAGTKRLLIAIEIVFLFAGVSGVAAYRVQKPRREAKRAQAELNAMLAQTHGMLISGRHAEATHLHPRIRELHTRVAPSQRQGYEEILRTIETELVAYQVDRGIAEAMTLLETLDDANADTALARHAALREAFHALPHGHKERLRERFQELDLIMTMYDIEKQKQGLQEAPADKDASTGE